MEENKADYLNDEVLNEVVMAEKVDFIGFLFQIAWFLLVTCDFWGQFITNLVDRGLSSTVLASTGSS